MALISEFIDDYKSKMGHYEHLAQTCACQCESALKRQGLRALVTSRAKKLDSLASKVETRAKEKAYKSVEEIYEDIVASQGYGSPSTFREIVKKSTISSVPILMWIMSRTFRKPCSIPEPIKRDSWAMSVVTTACG